MNFHIEDELYFLVYFSLAAVRSLPQKLCGVQRFDERLFWMAFSSETPLNFSVSQLMKYLTLQYQLLSGRMVSLTWIHCCVHELLLFVVDVNR